MPAGLVPGWEYTCPLVEIGGLVRDSSFVFNNPELSTPDRPVVETAPLARTLTRQPVFLILELGLIEPRLEEPVRRAGEATAANLELLFADCGVEIAAERVRTVVELEMMMANHRLAGTFTHIIIIGHGNQDGLGFLDADEPVGGTRLAELLGCFDGCPDTQILSLCCHSGCGTVACELSKAPNFTEVIGPSQTFDVLWVPTFISGYFLKLFSSGLSTDDALLQAANWSNETPMAIWRDGTEVTAP